MEKIDIKGIARDRDNIVYWALIAALTSNPENQRLFGAQDNAHGIEVELKINGLEFSFSHILNRLKQNIQGNIEEEARKLLKEQAAKVHELMDTLSSELDSTIDKCFPDRDRD